LITSVLTNPMEMSFIVIIAGLVTKVGRFYALRILVHWNCAASIGG